jgi:hypothetical protein
MATRVRANRPPRRRAKPDAEAEEPTTNGRNWAFIMILSVYLIGTLVYRALTPAHALDEPSVVYLTMALDALALVALVRTRLKLAEERVLPRGETVLFWVGAAAGVCVLMIRTLSDSAWWTGHLVFYLEPR